jgi:hypothetical protein
LYWCCSHLGLAVLWRCSQANNRDTGSRTWLVAGRQADDRKLDARLDEATGRFRKASPTRCADRALRPLHRRGEGTAADAKSRSAAANGRATRRWSRPDDTCDRPVGVRSHGTNREDSRASAAAPRCSRAQAYSSAAVLANAGTAAHVAGNTTASPINGARRLMSGSAD